MKRILQAVSFIVLFTQALSAGAISHNGVNYDAVTSPYTGKVWLDRNLGAERVCQDSNDTQCFGDYYQWGREADGHEKRTSSTTTVLSSSIDPAHSAHIISDFSSLDWTTADADGSLRSARWDKSDGTSICPVGFRVPTASELEAEFIDNNETNTTTKAFESFFKLGSAADRIGEVIYSDNPNIRAIKLWSSTPSVDGSAELGIYGTDSSRVFYEGDRARAYPVRCVEDIGITLEEGFTQDYLNDRTFYGIFNWKESPTSPDNFVTYQVVFNSNGTISNINTPDGNFTENYTLVNGLVKVENIFDWNLTAVSGDYLTVNKINHDAGENRYDTLEEYLHFDQNSSTKHYLGLKLVEQLGGKTVYTIKPDDNTLLETATFDANLTSISIINDANSTPVVESVSWYIADSNVTYITFTGPNGVNTAVADLSNFDDGNATLTFDGTENQPRLDLLLAEPKVYNYTDADGDSNVITVTKGATNSDLNINYVETSYSEDFNQNLSVNIDYFTTWTGSGYEGYATKDNFVYVDGTIYDENNNPIRTIITFDKAKRYVNVDLKNRLIKFKSYELYRIEYVGYFTVYLMGKNDDTIEVTASEYSSYMSNFENDFSLVSAVVDRYSDEPMPEGVKNQIFDDLLYNHAPTADAGADQSVELGENVTFDGAGSYDADGNITAYEWRLGSEVLSTQVSFTKSDLPLGTHTISLTVTDNDDANATDSMQITVNDGYSWSVSEWNFCVGSCGVDNSLQTRTVQCMTSSGVVIADSYCTEPKPISSQTCTSSLCQAPVANAGLDHSAEYGTNITFDGSGSYDANGDITAYEWKLGDVVLSTLVIFTKSDLAVGSHAVSLKVTDATGLYSTDTVNIQITPLDSDNDGLDDNYENLYGLDPNSDADALLDLDNDGKNNLQEYQDGTEPDNAYSRIYTLDLLQGWNLVSLELFSSLELSALDNEFIETIWSLQNNEWKVWTRNNISTTYGSLLSLEDGYGYWVQATKSTSIDIKGNGVPRSLTILPNEWNLIGSRVISDVYQYLTDNPSIKVFWKYVNGKFKASSNDQIILEGLSLQSILEINSINSNEGFFIKTSDVSSSFSCVENFCQSPVVDIDNQVVVEGSVVTLDASSVVDVDGEIVSYEWKEGETLLSTEVSFSKSDFAVGNHDITLTVTDNDGMVTVEEVLITVNEITYSIIDDWISYEQIESVVYDSNMTENVDDDIMYLYFKYADIDPSFIAKIDYYLLSHGNGFIDENSTVDFVEDLKMLKVSLNSSSTAFITGSDSVSFKNNTNQTVLVPFVNMLQTGQSLSYYSGDDAYYKSGLSKQLVRDDVTGIVTDTRTSLMWLDSAEVLNRSYSDAKSFCANLVVDEVSDWRLPEIDELTNLIDFGNADSKTILDVFQNGNSSVWWSNTGSGTTNSHYIQLLSVAYISSNINYSQDPANDRSWIARCVSGKYASQQKTFIDQVDVVVDTTSKLMWEKSTYNSANKKNYFEAVDYCENLSLAGYTDWRLPNVNEWMSLITTSGGEGADSLIAKRNEFNYLSTGRLWTSTSHDKSGLVYESLGYTEEYKDLAYYFDYDYVKSQGTGNIDLNAKAKGSHNVACVRSYE